MYINDTIGDGSARMPLFTLEMMLVSELSVDVSGEGYRLID